MDNEIISKNDIQNIIKIENINNYSKIDALKEFDELKNIALNCFDKNGNPNISAALRALENKAKVAGLYTNTKQQANCIVNMGEITIDGEQLKLNIGEDYLNEL